LIGVAVNITEVPEITGFADGTTVRLTGSSGLTAMFTALEVAGLPEIHDAFEVSTQVIPSLFEGA
jgi:hypothetical protein